MRNSLLELIRRMIQYTELTRRVVRLEHRTCFAFEHAVDHDLDAVIADALGLVMTAITNDTLQIFADMLFKYALINDCAADINIQVVGLVNRSINLHFMRSDPDVVHAGDAKGIHLLNSAGHRGDARAEVAFGT